MPPGVAIEPLFETTGPASTTWPPGAATMLPALSTLPEVALPPDRRSLPSMNSPTSMLERGRDQAADAHLRARREIDAVRVLQGRRWPLATSEPKIALGSSPVTRLSATALGRRLDEAHRVAGADREALPVGHQPAGRLVHRHVAAGRRRSCAAPLTTVAPVGSSAAAAAGVGGFAAVTRHRDRWRHAAERRSAGQAACPGPARCSDSAAPPRPDADAARTAARPMPTCPRPRPCLGDGDAQAARAVEDEAMEVSCS